MRFPPRLAHLATRPVVVAKLAPTYALAHGLDDDEAIARLTTALAGTLLDDLLTSTWEALKGSTKRLEESGLLEKVAQSLRDRPMRPGRVAKLTPAFSAFLVLADLEVGTASDAARKVMETEQGRKMAREGLADAGQHLAAELTR